MVKSKRTQVIEKSNGRCWFCGMYLRPKIVTMDHLIPSHKGGKSTLDNMVAACLNCNHEKGSMSLEEYRIQTSVYRMGGPTFDQDQLNWIGSQIIVLPTTFPYE